MRKQARPTGEELTLFRFAFLPVMNYICNYALAAEEISGCYYICNYATYIQSVGFACPDITPFVCCLFACSTEAASPSYDYIYILPRPPR